MQLSYDAMNHYAFLHPASLKVTLYVSFLDIFKAHHQGRTEELKRGGGDLKNAVTTATRPVGPSLRRDEVQGKGCALSLG